MPKHAASNISGMNSVVVDGWYIPFITPISGLNVIGEELSTLVDQDTRLSRVCLLRGTDWIFIHNSTFCPQSVFMCFVWIWEQTAIISLYSINWLVFVTETECVYYAVRTGSLYIILRSAHTVYLCALCGSENKQRLFPYTALTDRFL